MSTAKIVEKKNTQVSATIPTPLYDALDNYRWENRVEKFGGIVTQALEEFAENHGLNATAAPEEPAKA